MHLICPPNFALALFSISLGTTVIPRRNKKQRLCQPRSQCSLLPALRRTGRREPWERGWGYAKCWGANEVYYGRCGSGVLASVPAILRGTFLWLLCRVIHNRLWCYISAGLHMLRWWGYTNITSSTWKIQVQVCLRTTSSPSLRNQHFFPPGRVFFYVVANFYKML